LRFADAVRVVLLDFDTLPQCAQEERCALQTEEIVPFTA
jgi:hypothetical protein